MKFISYLAALLFFFCFTAALQAQPLADKVPANAVLYLGWTGADALAPAYQKSALKGLMEATNLSANTGTIVDQLCTRFAPAQPELIAGIKQALATGGILWHHPIAFYVGPLDDLDGKSGGPPPLGFIIDAGADADTLEAQIKSALAHAPPDAPTLTRSGNLLTLATPYRAATPFLALADSPDFKAALAAATPAANGADAFLGYVDFPRMLAFADRAITATAPADALAHWKSFRKNAALDSLGRLAFRGAMTDRGWDEAAFFSVAANRTGLLTLFNSAAVEDAQLKLVPKDAIAMDASRMDLGAEWLAFRDVLVKTNPDIGRQMDLSLAQIQQITGVDLQKQIIAALGDTWTDYQTAGAGGGFIFVNVLKDPLAFDDGLTALEDLYNKQAATRNPAMTIRTTTVGDLQIKSIAVQTSQICWTVTDGKLFVGSTPRLINKAVQNTQQQLAGTAPTMLDNADFQAVRKTLSGAVGGGNVVALSYNDLRQTVPQQLLALQLVLGMANMFGANISPDLLPTVDEVGPFLAPSGSLSWVDSAGLHTRGRTPFPGAELAGGQGTLVAVAAVSMGVAVLIPSLGRAKELANRSAEGANLTGIAKACALYSAENNDAMPEHLAQLIARGNFGPKQLISKSSNTAPLVLTDDQMKAAQADWTTIKDQVDKHCDFIYCGAGTKEEVDASIPLIFGKPGLHGKEGIEVAFQDTHVEWIKMRGVPALIDTMNAYRRKNNLPEIKIEIPAGLLPQPAPVSATEP